MPETDSRKGKHTPAKRKRHHTHTRSAVGQPGHKPAKAPETATGQPRKTTKPGCGAPAKTTEAPNTGQRPPGQTTGGRNRQNAGGSGIGQQPTRFVQGRQPHPQKKQEGTTADFSAATGPQPGHPRPCNPEPKPPNATINGAIA